MGHPTTPAEGIRTQSAKYGDADCQRARVEELRGLSAANLRETISNSHATLSEALDTAKPDSKESGFRMSALIGSEHGTTESEVVESVGVLNDDLSMARAVLREKDYQAQVFNSAGEQTKLIGEQAMEVASRTLEGQTHLSMCGRDTSTAVGMLAAANPQFSELLESKNLKRGLTDGIDFPISMGSLASARAQNSFFRPSTTNTTEGWSAQIIRDNKLVYDIVRGTQLLNVLPMTAMQNGGYRHMQEATVVNAAAATAEGGAYPKQILRVNEVTTNAEKIAIFITVSEEQLQDVMNITAYLDNRLPYLLMSEIENQIINGTGTGGNWKGITKQTGVAVKTKTSGTHVYNHILKSISDVETNRKMPVNILAMNRATKALLQMEQVGTGDGRFILGHPGQMPADTLWGIPIIVANAIPDNEALVGIASDLAIGEQQGLRLEWGRNDDDFEKGRRSLRAECRGNVIMYQSAGWHHLKGLNT